MRRTVCLLTMIFMACQSCQHHPQETQEDTFVYLDAPCTTDSECFEKFGE